MREEEGLFAEVDSIGGEKGRDKEFSSEYISWKYSTIF